MEPGEIQLCWRELFIGSKEAGRHRDIPSRETDTAVSAGKVRLAVSESGLGLLLLPVAFNDPVPEQQASQLISVRPISLIVDGKRVRFVELRCEEEHLNEVFARVISDILRRIESGIAALEAINEALEEFRRLLHMQRTTSVDELIVAGLIGELVTLIEALRLQPAIVPAWHGADSDRHDFRAGTVSIEVKTSLGAGRSRVHINGLRQLEQSGDEILILRHICIEPDPAGPLFVPELVAEASELAADRTELEKKLEHAGYTETAQNRWALKRYRHVESAAYEVAEGFPRITPSLLTAEWPIAGVSGVSYEVDLSAAGRFRMDDSAWRSRLEELCAWI